MHSRVAEKTTDGEQRLIMHCSELALTFGTTAAVLSSTHVAFAQAPAPPPAPIAPPAVAAEAPAPAPPPPAAAPGAPIKTTGSFMTRYEIREGYKGLGRSAGRFQEGEATVYRARLGLRTAPIETGGPDVVLQFTPQASGWIGETSTITDYDLGLHEGYLRLQGGGKSFDIGRFEMNYGDALVIGNLGWHQTARAFEGMRARVPASAGWVDFFFTQVAEGRTLSDPFGAGDQYFYGVYAGIGPAIAEGLALDLYALGQTAPGRGAVSNADNTGISQKVDPATEFTLGARVKNKAGILDYRLEAGLQFGSRPNVPAEIVYGPMPVVSEAVDSFAYQADGEIGVSPKPGFRASVGGLVASGNDPDTEENEGWNQLYPTAHKFLGLADVFGGRTNVASANATISYAVSPKLILRAQGHAFWKLEAPGDADGFTGTELDTHAVVPLGSGLTLRGMYGLFLANEGGAFRPEGSDDSAAHYLEIELSYALK